MIDRFGNPIRVAWADHEIEWVRAALTLPQRQRMDAFADIASMTGRAFCAVSDRASIIRAQDRAAIETAKAARILVPAYSTFPPRKPPAAVPTDFRWPSKKKMMGCR